MTFPYNRLAPGQIGHGMSLDLEPLDKLGAMSEAERLETEGLCPYD